MISRQGVGVLMTIHQPSWRIFRQFDKVYMLSPIARDCIYEGSPSGIIPYLGTKGLEPEEGTTPPDYITDVASGQAPGSSADVLADMANDHKEQFSGCGFDTGKDEFLSKALDSGTFDSIKCFRVLFGRTLKCFNRDLSVFYFQLITCFAAPLLFFFQVGGYRDPSFGCPPTLDDIPERLTPKKFLAMNAQVGHDVMNMSYNRNMMMAFQVFTSTAGLCLPLFSTQSELKIVWREVKNNSYGILVYFVAKTLCDLMMTAILAAAFSATAYPILGGNMDDVWRPFLFILSTLIQICLSHDFGVIVGATFRDAPLSVAIFLGMFIVLPSLIATGSLVHMDRSMDIAVGMNYLLPAKYAYDTAALSYFGYDACGMDLRKRVIAMQKAVTLWIYEQFTVVDSLGNSIFSQNNIIRSSMNNGRNMTIGITTGNLYQDMSVSTLSAVESLARTMAHSSTRSFIGYDGEVRSAGITYEFENIDSDLGRLLALGAIQIVTYRFAAYFLFVRGAKARF